MKNIEWLIQVAGKQVGIVLGAFIIKFTSMFIVNALVARIEDDDPDSDTALEQRAYTLRSLVGNVFNVVVFGTALIMLLAEWGINIAPILTGAGVLGLAIGFGAQSLVKDIVTGFFVLVENQFNVGDIVEIAGFKGKVQALRLRTTVIKGENGQIHTLPNSQLTKVTKFPKSSKKKK